MYIEKFDHARVEVGTNERICYYDTRTGRLLAAAIWPAGHFCGGFAVYAASTDRLPICYAVGPVDAAETAGPYCR